MEIGMEAVVIRRWEFLFFYFNFKLWFFNNFAIIFQKKSSTPCLLDSLQHFFYYSDCRIVCKWGMTASLSIKIYLLARLLTMLFFFGTKNVIMSYARDWMRRRQMYTHTGSKLSMKLLCIDGLMLNANFINRAFSLTTKQQGKRVFLCSFLNEFLQMRMRRLHRKS